MRWACKNHPNCQLYSCKKKAHSVMSLSVIVYSIMYVFLPSSFLVGVVYLTARNKSCRCILCQADSTWPTSSAFGLNHAKNLLSSWHKTALESSIRKSLDLSTLLLPNRGRRQSIISSLTLCYAVVSWGRYMLCCAKVAHQTQRINTNSNYCVLQNCTIKVLWTFECKHYS
jgi:hypothetical protein